MVISSFPSARSNARNPNPAAMSSGNSPTVANAS